MWAVPELVPYLGKYSLAVWGGGHFANSLFCHNNIEKSHLTVQLWSEH